MPFMVIYRTADGSSCYEHAAALDEAALFVERLRNKDAIDQARIYRMEEIGFAFRPYYKVELGAIDRTAPAADQGTRDRPAKAARSAAPSPEIEVAGAPVTVVTPEAGAPADKPEASSLPTPPPPPEQKASTGANGRQGLFGR